MVIFMLVSARARKIFTLIAVLTANFADAQFFFINATGGWRPVRGGDCKRRSILCK